MVGAALALGAASNYAPSLSHEAPAIEKYAFGSPDVLDRSQVIGRLGTSSTLELEPVLPIDPTATEGLTPQTQKMDKSMGTLPVAEAQAVINDLIPELEKSELRLLPDEEGVNSYSELLIASGECGGQFSVSKG